MLLGKRKNLNLSANWINCSAFSHKNFTIRRWHNAQRMRKTNRAFILQEVDLQRILIMQFKYF